METIILTDGTSSKEYEVIVPQSVYDEIIYNINNELANKYLQQEIEKENRLKAFRIVLQNPFQKSDEASCSNNINVHPDENTPAWNIENESSEYYSLPGSSSHNININAEVQKDNSRWTDADIKYLLELYRENESKLKNPNIKAKSVWDDIAQKMGSHNGEQCLNKFKNMKKTYKKIVDNNKSTGRGKLDWPYYSIMNGIFENTPEIEPLSLASSEKGFVSKRKLEGEKSALKDSAATKKTKTDMEPLWFQRFRADEERRHQERMHCQKQFLGLFRELIGKK